LHYWKSILLLKKALEIGCSGGITATGSKLFKHVHATGISAEMIRKSREAITVSNVTFHKLDGFTLKALPMTT